MKYKYRLIVLGSLNGIEENLRTLFYQRINDLGLQKKFYKMVYAKDFKSNFKANQPSYTIYFGDSLGNFQDLEKVLNLQTQGAPILPVFYDSFNKEIPKILSNLNGLKYDNSQVDKIVNLALESFGKLRSTRKIFISYRREESSSVAIQLYEALERSNFDVFLDTHSIKQGEPFQDELWHRMTDCDVIIILNTKGFLESKWCEAEITEANAKQIGIIQLVWPNHKMEKMAEICIPFNLRPEDFIKKYIQIKIPQSF